MGYTIHHAIIVSTNSPEREDIQKAWMVAQDIGCGVTNWVCSQVNATRTFIVIPDGSKEGWPESNEGDERREEFVDWLKAQEYADGSSSYHWVELSYGDEDGKKPEVINWPYSEEENSEPQ